MRATAVARSVAPLRAFALLGTVAVCACGEPAGPASEIPYPRVAFSEDGSRVDFEFGPGRLATTGTEPWGGSSVLEFPALLDPDAGPVEVELRGLDLSGIRYTGDMGWPPDSSDSGALVELELVGGTTVGYRLFSSLEGRRELWDGAVIAEADLADYRAYIFQAWEGEDRLHSTWGYRAERWGGDRVSPFDMLDVRTVYDPPTVSLSTRLHASWSWIQGDSASGRSCPWNPAINTALPGTADEGWDGSCAPASENRSGRNRGAWLTPEAASWRPEDDAEIVHPRVAISNWLNAREPYRISWQGLRVSGASASELPLAVGRGRVPAWGTAAEARSAPRGEDAAFSFVVAGRGQGGRSVGQLVYRTPGFRLTSLSIAWLLLEEDEVAFSGAASVNGESGYRYELRAAREPDPDSTRLVTLVWRSVEGPEHPVYLAFGTTGSEAIILRPGDRS